MLVKIIKNKKVVDSNNEFTYVIECHHGNLIDRTAIKIPATLYMLPDETIPNMTNDNRMLESWLEQLSFQYDDINIDNYTTLIEEL